jgi:hypothetical protein
MHTIAPTGQNARETSMAKQKSFYMTERTEAALRSIAADSLSEMINKVVDRYEVLMAFDRKRLRSLFSEAAWRKLVAACADTRKVDSARLEMAVRAALQGETDDLTMMDVMTPAEIFCVIEMAEAEALQAQPASTHQRPGR